MRDLIGEICRERPVGTANNDRVNAYLKKRLCAWGYDVQSLPFDCLRWESAASQLRAGNETFAVMPSPFSQGFAGAGRLVLADTLDALTQPDCKGQILILSGELTQAPLQPKDYPFYYPDEDRLLITALEQKSPGAIIALTDREPLCGLSPFPLFEDGNFKIPSAYMHVSMLGSIRKHLGTAAQLSIVSSNHPQKSGQLMATKYGKNRRRKIVVCAHVDTKYNTPGALDNAAGVAVLMETAAKLIPAENSIDIIPFNGEEYFAAGGELAYLQYLQDAGETISLLINIDSPCHIGAGTAVSFYNFGEREKSAAVSLFREHPTIGEGEPWYAGDHCAFAFNGTPCVAIASADLFSGGLASTHTPNDVPACIDIHSVAPVAAYIAALIRAWEK